MTDFSDLTMMFSLPRSRSQWWTWAFSHGLVRNYALHDTVGQFASPRQFVRGVRDYLDRKPGTKLFIADTSAIYYHRQLLSMMPGMQRIYMFRNVEDVVDSLRKQTGHRIDKLIRDQAQLLFRHAYSDDNLIRLHWGCINEGTIESLWPRVTGLPSPDQTMLTYMLGHKVDVPVMEQPHTDPEIARSMWGYRETLDSP